MNSPVSSVDPDEPDNTDNTEEPGEPAHSGSIVVVAGVSSSGKTTIGKALAERLGARFLDADDFHPPANVSKMASGIPLDDADRWPWLDLLNSELRQAAADSESVVLACSALKATYRERLADGVHGLTMILLTGTKEVLAERAAARTHRYMPPSLLDSQLATLEPLDSGEGWEIDVSRPVTTIVEDLALRLGH